MKSFLCILLLTLLPTLACAEDMAAMISQYRRDHGLPAVKFDARLTAIAERQAHAMASSGVMDHDVAGPFSSRVSGANLDAAGENIAAGTKTWAETLRVWENSPGHNANLLLASADSLGVAVARNEQTQYKTYWAMVIGHKEGPHKDGPHKLRMGPWPMQAASETPEPAPKRHRSDSSNSPGFLDSLGTALKNVTSPIRNLLN